MEAVRPLASNHSLLHSPLTWCFKPKESPQNALQTKVSRRMGGIIAIGASISVVGKEKKGEGKEEEEAEKGVRENAEALKEVKGLLEEEEWGEAQRVVRKSGSNLKKDLYVIIQSRDGRERGVLRQLYSRLFNNLTKLDYAARDKDAGRVWEYYNNVVSALHHLLSTI